MQFTLTEEQQFIVESATKFTADNITPFAAQWDEEHVFPRHVFEAAAELGFGSIYVSEESGGIGMGRLEAALIMEAMAYGCPSTSAFISIHNMASKMIDTYATEGVKETYLPDLITMKSWQVTVSLSRVPVQTPQHFAQPLNLTVITMWLTARKPLFLGAVKVKFTL